MTTDDSLEWMEHGEPSDPPEEPDPVLDKLRNPPWMAVGVEVCKALGLDPHDVRALRIDIAVGEVPMVTVTRIVPTDRAHPLGRALSRFKLVPEDDGK